MFLRLIIFLLIFAINLLNGSYIKDEFDKDNSEKGVLVSANIEAEYVLKIKPADGIRATKSQMETISSVTRIKLDNMGYYDAVISNGNNDTILIGFPEKPDNLDDIEKAVCQKPMLTLRDYKGNILMEGTDEFLRDAQMQYGQTNSFGEAEYFVSLALTEKGQEKFMSATETVLGYAEDGNNYISIYLDDILITMPVVGAVINADSCIISGSFTKESATALAAQIRRGMLPFELVCE